MTEKPKKSLTKVTKGYVPEFPEQLGSEARRIWDRLLPVLMEEDHFRPGDEIGLIMVCHAYAQYLEASEAQVKYGSVIKTKNGNFIHSPYVSVANQQASSLISLLKEYGFTPASRGRLPSKILEDPIWEEVAMK
jgi:P27 family predicted phage terminase small subunit